MRLTGWEAPPASMGAKPAVGAEGAEDEAVEDEAAEDGGAGDFAGANPTA